MCVKITFLGTSYGDVPLGFQLRVLGGRLRSSLATRSSSSKYENSPSSTPEIKTTSTLVSLRGDSAGTPKQEVYESQKPQLPHHHHQQQQQLEQPQPQQLSKQQQQRDAAVQTDSGRILPQASLNELVRTGIGELFRFGRQNDSLKDTQDIQRIFEMVAQEEAKLAEKPLQDLLSRSMVDIYVGPENTHWVLHEKLLCARSAFFRDVFYTEKGGNSRSKTYGLPDDDDDAFRAFVGWLYSGAVPPPRSETDLAVLFELFLMGERWEIAALRHDTLEAVRSWYADHDTYPGLRRVQYVYANTEDGSEMRALLVSSIARMFALSDGIPVHWDKALRKNGQLAVDIIRAVQEWQLSRESVPDARGGQRQSQNFEDLSMSSASTLTPGLAAAPLDGHQQNQGLGLLEKEEGVQGQRNIGIDPKQNGGFAKTGGALNGIRDKTQDTKKTFSELPNGIQTLSI